MSENLISDRVILRNRQDSVNLEEAIMMYISIIKEAKERNGPSYDTYAFLKLSVSWRIERKD